MAALIVALSALALYGITQLKFDDDPRNIFKTHEADFLRLEAQFAEFGSDDNDCIFVLEGESFFTRAVMSEIRRLEAEIEARLR